ncbi:hypothetical protein PHLGIDRAFT_124280 [Phlebiopsis gigantea 11061_1 CR5-6]|uniref:Uncharacterized protein n=1 Tax=Phlebiopsis gigantea (strain 11061_1 CR5-6) TaxID=745531 RepID=A0A0C3SDR9_PHLG1|nr:hypothetical protein PHLGIDRAFT_124280 [Phlebiopsis gigantea 11061_1 CR5-6]
MPHFARHDNTNAAIATGGLGTNGAGGGYDHRTSDRVGPLGTGAGPTMQPAQPAGGYGSTNTAPGHGQGAYQSGMTNFPPRYDNTNEAGVAGGDPYANTVGNNDVAPVDHFGNGQSSGGASATAGKVERIIGTMVCSSSLKAKGLQKEQQAAAHQVQNAEISEAERLEQEASLRRQRAVDHGAHPANRALGGAAQAQEFGGNFGQLGSAGGPVSGNAGARSGAM